MKRARRPAFWAAVLAAAVAMAASHPWSAYDDTRGLWIKGVIVSTSYVRPHQLIQLETQEREPRTWTVVLASPSKMESRGLPVKRLVHGLAVRVYVYPARDVELEGRALRIVIDGNTTELW
jgi:hypothetical protein